MVQRGQEETEVAQIPELECDMAGTKTQVTWLHCPPTPVFNAYIDTVYLPRIYGLKVIEKAL